MRWDATKKFPLFSDNIFCLRQGLNIESRGLLQRPHITAVAENVKYFPLTQLLIVMQVNFRGWPSRSVDAYKWLSGGQGILAHLDPDFVRSM